MYPVVFVLLLSHFRVLFCLFVLPALPGLSRVIFPRSHNHGAISLSGLSNKISFSDHYFLPAMPNSLAQRRTMVDGPALGDVKYASTFPFSNQMSVSQMAVKSC